jgi:anti-anti-sigma factor
MPNFVTLEIKSYTKMNKLLFKLNANDETVELAAFGELTANNATDFRSHLIKLLQHGRQRAYKLNLKNATALDASAIELIYILRRELSAVNASLILTLPADPEVKAFLMKTGFLQTIS